MAHLNRVKASSSDGQAGYLSEEIVAGNGIDIQEIENSGNRTLSIANLITSASDVSTNETGQTVQDILDTIPQNLSDLNDVIYQTGDPSDANVLTYDSGLGKWTPKPATSGGGGTSGISFFMAGNVYVGENVMMIRVPKAFTISNVQISVLTAPSGSALTVDVNYVSYSADSTQPTFVSIFNTTQANRPSISSGNYSDTSGTPDTTSISAGGFLSFSVDAVGSTITGANLMITIVGT